MFTIGGIFSSPALVRSARARGPCGAPGGIPLGKFRRMIRPPPELRAAQDRSILPVNPPSPNACPPGTDSGIGSAAEFAGFCAGCGDSSTAMTYDSKIPAPLEHDTPPIRAVKDRRFFRTIIAFIFLLESIKKTAGSIKLAYPDDGVNEFINAGEKLLAPRQFRRAEAWRLPGRPELCFTVIRGALGRPAYVWAAVCERL